MFSAPNPFIIRDDIQISHELTVREMFEQLLKNKKVTLLLSFSDADNLFSHLNVIKSREKKLFESLGFDFERKILRMQRDSVTNAVEYWMEEPQPNKRYKIFKVEDRKQD